MQRLKQKDAAFNLSEHDLNEFGFILLQQGKNISLNPKS
jgi:hypothetical protein